MSVCTCEVLHESEQRRLVSAFLQSNTDEWNLLALKDMYESGNTLDDIRQTVPFRGYECTRVRVCCSECTRVCKYRCIQDSLNRLYMLRKTYEGREDAPLAVKMMLKQNFRTAEELAVTIGDYISTGRNPKVAQYVKETGVNPYKMSYEPRYRLDEEGNRIVNSTTGEISVLDWPETGLCPYCRPSVTIDRRKIKRK